MLTHTNFHFSCKQDSPKLDCTTNMNHGYFFVVFFYPDSLFSNLLQNCTCQSFKSNLSEGRGCRIYGPWEVERGSGLQL